MTHPSGRFGFLPCASKESLAPLKRGRGVLVYSHEEIYHRLDLAWVPANVFAVLLEHCVFIENISGVQPSSPNRG